MSKSTPGPWKWVFIGTMGKWALLHYRTPYNVDYVDVGGPPSNPLSADQRLIGAAPLMYEFIERKANDGDGEATKILEAINGHA